MWLLNVEFKNALLNILFRFMSTRADEIEIPDRIERRPTDILKAISSTLTTDYTAPHYRFNKILYY